MSLQHEIKQAYDAVHAPDALTERLKQELYRSDLRDEAELLTCEVTEAPKRRPLLAAAKGIAFVAASLALCIGCGFAVWGLRDQVVDFHPGANVSAPASVKVPDVTGSTAEEARQMLERAGFRVEVMYHGALIDLAELPADSSPVRTEPAAGSAAERDSVVVLYLAGKGE